ncbi:hypothetical protein E2C01_078397 [Portunus trituberculatus]|uniref:Uncharacterized protein n=1 Tax=Portunus trituberculatus TaxID=210409 RepID=A0A5B7IIM4_PORTR|nr:hypothetical protein [Portunus trituberculatus]
MAMVSTSISTSTTAFVATKLSIAADLETRGDRGEVVVVLEEGVVQWIESRSHTGLVV